MSVLFLLCNIRLATSDEMKNTRIAWLHLFESELVRRLFTAKSLTYASSQISTSAFLWAEACNSRFVGELASPLVEDDPSHWPGNAEFIFSERTRCMIWSIADAMNTFWGAEIIHLSSATCPDLFRERHFAGKRRSVKYAGTSIPRTRAFSLINHAITVSVKRERERERQQSQRNTALSALSFPTVLRCH